MGAVGGNCSGGCNDRCADGKVVAYEWRVPSRPPPPTDDAAWMPTELLDPFGPRTGEPYRAIAEDGINVRLGLELDTPVVRKVPEGTLFHVFARQVNAQGIERLRTVEGWTSLRGASDGRLVAEPFRACSPSDEAEDVVERCLVESKSPAFRSARSSTSRSVHFAEQLAETREVYVGESASEDDVSVGALIDGAAPWLFGSLALTSTGDGVAFLPECVQGKRVLVHLGSGRYVVDNSQLRADAPRLGYRRSMEVEDRSPTPGPVWGSVVRGRLQDGWLETNLPRASAAASRSGGVAALSFSHAACAAAAADADAEEVGAALKARTGAHGAMRSLLAASALLRPEAPGEDSAADNSGRGAGGDADSAWAAAAPPPLEDDGRGGDAAEALACRCSTATAAAAVASKAALKAAPRSKLGGA